MVIAIVILVFLVLGTGFACLNLFAYWKKANKERDEAQKSQKEWDGSEPSPSDADPEKPVMPEATKPIFRAPLPYPDQSKQ